MGIGSYQQNLSNYLCKRNDTGKVGWLINCCLTALSAQTGYIVKYIM